LKTIPTQQNALGRILLDQSNYFITDKDGLIICSSKTFCQLSGYKEKELIGKPCHFIQAKGNDSSLHISIVNHLQNHNTWKGEIYCIKKNNEYYWLESTILILPSSNNTPPQYLYLHSDIGHNKELLTSINDRARKQGLLAIIGQLSLMCHDNIQIFIEQTIAAITGTLDMSCGMFYNINKKQTEAFLIAHVETSSSEDPSSLIDLTKNGMLNLIINSDEPVLIDLKTENKFHIDDFFKKQNLRYCLCKRIGDDETCRSIILLFSEFYSTIQNDDMNFLQAISNIINETIIRKNISDKLKEEKILSQKYIDATNAIIIALDNNGKIILANKKSANILKQEQSNLIGLNWVENFIPVGSYTEKNSIEKTFKNEMLPGISGKLKSSTSEIITRTGEKRLIKWNNAILNHDKGEILSTISVGEDITEIEKIRQEKNRLQSKLQQAQKMEALGQLTAGIAHDFNNILAGILGFSQLAIEKISNDKSETGNKLTLYLKDIEKAGYRGKEVINQMLNFSRTHSEELQNVSLPSLVKDTIKMLRATIPASMTFNIMIDDDVPAVIADPSNLNQVIMNLLINSRDALKSKGALTVSVFNHEIKNNTCSSCNKEFSGRYVNLSISDNGPGISRRHLPLIFNDDFTSKEKNKGFGKGLANVHKIIHSSEAHITVETSTKGSTFNILFKVATGSPETETQTAALEQPVDTNKHILIVDDENTIAKYLEELFTQCGYKVSLFTDPTQALKAFKENPSSYDMLLTDQTMPMITGAELAQEILQINAELPVVLCTGHSDLIDEEKAAAMNIKGFLRKPVETHKLLECVYQLLQ